MSTMDLVFRDHKVRVDRNSLGEPIWVAKDVCEVLELSNVSEALRTLEDDEKSSIRNPDVTSAGGNPTLLAVSESGLYALIFKSRKPIARDFRKWVTATVLPQIRRTGSFESDKLVSQLLATQESDRKYWLARDTATNERVNKLTEEVSRLRVEMVGLRHPEPIGKAEGNEIRRRMRDLARARVKLDPGYYVMSPTEKKSKYLSERRAAEDELRRLIKFPRDTGNSFDSMPSDKSGELQMQLNTMETKAYRELSQRDKADRDASQQSLFGAEDTDKPN